SSTRSPRGAPTRSQQRSSRRTRSGCTSASASAGAGDRRAGSPRGAIEPVLWSAVAPAVEQDLARGVRARGAGDAAARVGAGVAQVQPVERHPVARVTEQRPPREELIEARLAVEGVALGQPVIAFQVEGRDHLPRGHQVAETRGILVKYLYYLVAERVAFGI